MGAGKTLQGFAVAVLIACQDRDTSPAGTPDDVATHEADEDVGSDVETGDDASERSDEGVMVSENDEGSAADDTTPDPRPDVTTDATGVTEPPTTDSSSTVSPSATSSEMDPPFAPPSVPSADASAMDLCRYYFDTICARITECDAPRFRPCASPADLCPDILFGADSAWTAADVFECAQTWNSHSCDELVFDRWPACSMRPGTRALGSTCVFDAQCESTVCAGGVVPAYALDCGACASPAQLGEACDERLPCARGMTCSANVCVEITRPEPAPSGTASTAGGLAPPPTPECDESNPCLPGRQCDAGVCKTVDVGFLPLGEACSRFTECEPGLECGIELIPEPDPEPEVGTCQPRPAIGNPCLPTFGHVGACEEGGTCTRRPTGDCVPLREVGESCGWTSCVEGAFCQVIGLDDAILESHFCYPLRVEGEACWGFDICADGMACTCTDEACEESVCARARQAGESCNELDLLCAPELRCMGGVCIVPQNTDPRHPPQLGEACDRHTPFGRIGGNCDETVVDMECLCSTPDCAAAYCAYPSLEGESCNENTELCRQGYRCENEICVALETQNIEQNACGTP